MGSDRTLAGLGVLGVVISLGTVLLATLASPEFTWSENALSNLGVTETAAGTQLTVVLFNGGLALGGIIGSGFAVVLWQASSATGKRIVAGLLGVTMVTMALIGVFPQGTSLHSPMATAFFALITITLWTDAIVVRETPEGRRGAVTAWLGGANIIGWLIWALTGPFQRPGLAIPEIVGALALSAWVASASIRLSQWEPPEPLTPRRES